jgi:hypothetical protein
MASPGKKSGVRTHADALPDYGRPARARERSNTDHASASVRTSSNLQTAEKKTSECRPRGCRPRLAAFSTRPPGSIITASEVADRRRPSFALRACTLKSTTLISMSA